MINIEHLSYTYNLKKYAVNDVSTTINEKDFIAIVGHTGSGKSTFIQNLNALLIPSSGKVIVDEFTITNKIKIKNIKELRRKIGIVFQFPEYQLFEETVEKDIAFGPKNFGVSEDNLKETIINALKMVGLDESFLEKSPFELSGGEKRRVAIAGILAFNPDVLIVDEPTAGLDPKSAIEMMDLFKKLNENGKTILLVTHQMEQVLAYASRVLVFNAGKLVSDTTPVSLFYDESKVASLGLEEPSLIKLVLKLAKKHPKLLDYNIKTMDDFVTSYKEVINL